MHESSLIIHAEVFIWTTELQKHLFLVTVTLTFDEQLSKSLGLLNVLLSSRKPTYQVWTPYAQLYSSYDPDEIIVEHFIVRDGDIGLSRTTPQINR